MTDPQRAILAHGFTQTARSWDVLVDHLNRRLPGLSPKAVDLPGHGSAADVETDLWGSARHLVGHGGRGIYVGYSMGGRVALHAALADAADVDALVLVGATAGIEDPDERAARRAADDRLADHVEEVGVITFVDEWLQNPLFSGLTADTAMRADRLRNTASGLASSLRTTGTGTQEPLWGRLGEIEVPVLLLVGERDQKFRAIAERMHDRLPSSDLVVVPDAGHSVHLERPEPTADAMASWWPSR